VEPNIDNMQLNEEQLEAVAGGSFLPWDFLLPALVDYLTKK
jgi:hypothetical protein